MSFFGDATAQAHIEPAASDTISPFRGRIHRMTPMEPAPPSAGSWGEGDPYGDTPIVRVQSSRVPRPLLLNFSQHPPNFPA